MLLLSGLEPFALKTGSDQTCLLTGCMLHSCCVTERRLTISLSSDCNYSKINQASQFDWYVFPPIKGGCIILGFVFPSFLSFFEFRRISAFRRFDPSRIPLLALQVFLIFPAIDRQFRTRFPCTFFTCLLQWRGAEESGNLLLLQTKKNPPNRSFFLKYCPSISFREGEWRLLDL